MFTAVSTDAGGDDDGLRTMSESTPLLRWGGVVSSHDNKNGTNNEEQRQKQQQQPNNNRNVLVTLWNLLIFDWFTPILYKGNEQKVLYMEDLNLVPLPNNCFAQRTFTNFDYYWQQELYNVSNKNTNNDKNNKNNNHNKKQKRQQQPSMISVMVQLFGYDFLYAALLKLVHDCCLFIGPQILKRMIHYLREPYQSWHRALVKGFVLILTVTASQIIMSLCLRHYFYKCYTIGLRIRTCLTIAIYKKALKLSSIRSSTANGNGGGGGVSGGNGTITNLMSIDVQHIQDLTTYINTIWSSPFQLCVGFYFLYNELGFISTMGGILIILIMIPVTKFIAGYIIAIQKNVTKQRDARVSYNNELLTNIKIIKYQSWEQSFLNILSKLRTIELKQLYYYYINTSCSDSLWTLTPFAVSIITFGIYTIVLGNTLTVATALTSLSLFDILRFPLFVLPQVINDLIESYISIQRIQSFLLSKEHTKIANNNNMNEQDYNNDNHNTIGSVLLSNVTATYSTPANNNTIMSKKDGKTTTNFKEDPIHQNLLLQSQWEVSTLQAQLQEAERLLLQQGNKPSSNNNNTEIKSLISYGSQLLTNDYDNEKIQSNNNNNNNSSLLSLKRITMECLPGQFIVVVGNVGSGKSTILNTLLGEQVHVLTTRSSTIDVRGTIAYFSQTPFIMNATVRDNILFSHTSFSSSSNDNSNKNNNIGYDGVVNEELYQRAIQCCSLQHDLDLLPYGDETIIGERGITISGGQKARIALARTVYHNANITIIDDALSAVDAHVAKHIFDNAIINELLVPNTNTYKSNTNSPVQNRSVILVTNALQYLNHPRVDKIYVLNDGRIIEQGTYKELVNDTNSTFSRYMSVVSDNNNNTSVTEKRQNTKMKSSKLPIKNDTMMKIDVSTTTTKDDDSTKSATKKIMKEPITEETRETGHVGYDVYMTWVNAAGGIYVPILFILMYMIVEGSTISSNWWLTYWSEHSLQHSQTYFFTIYTCIVTFVVIAGLVSSMIIAYFGLHASGKLFSGMIESVLHARMSFFDTTPVGRLVNRFSKDIYTTDEQLTQTVNLYFTTLFSVISTIVVITTVTPIFAICLIPMLIFYLKEQQFFTLTYRELKRLDSIARSPIFSLLGESIDGAAVIRAFGAEPTLLRRMVSILDTQQHAYFLTCTAQSWLAIRLELVGTLIITFACSSAVLQHLLSGANTRFAGLAGLAISYSLSVTQSLNWSVRMASDLEAAMVSVERIREYSMLESEGARTTGIDKQVEGNWPASGNIEFIGVKFRYRPELPLILKGLDLKIPGGSKVGVVGRTGAGKSTLMVSLMRIVELHEGKIMIDGIDTRTLGLSKLRGSIAVIPQDPVLFSGTVRTNLDPFNDNTDEVLLEALERVGLYKAGINKLSTDSLTGLSTNTRVDSLDNAVSEGGSNFSVGQRQLLVIARALLRGTKIVIMDEATASIDAETDAMIQKVLRTAFTNATCLTVAHRLNTIMDSDYILVMDDGKAAEFDTPSNLMTKGGMFHDLVQAASN